MNKFFSRNSDYDLFKKALRSTKNEPVVINILSNDSSLLENEENTPVVTERKQMSSKFQASPFDKFFGPKKKRVDPVDMKDFSSWKNKNYRESEKRINEEPEESTKFSFADYLSEKTKNEKYNTDDQIKNENQKSIEQLSSGDEDYKKFSLDSYLNKLEQESKVRKDFEKTEDLIDSNFGEDFDQNVMEDQDENFASETNVDVEDFVRGSDVGGDKFAFDKDELDTFKARLDKMEREANNIKEKPTSKVISADEIKEIKGEDEDSEEFNLGKLGFEDDIEKVNEKINSLNKVLEITGDEETETPKVEHKKFFEIKKNFDDENEETSTEITDKISNDDTEKSIKSEDDSDATIDALESETQTQKSDIDENDGVVSPKIISGSVSEDSLDDDIIDDIQDNFVDVVTIPETEIDKDLNIKSNTDDEDVGKDYLTKSDFKNFTEEIVNKFSEMYRANNGTVDANPQEFNQEFINPNTNQMYPVSETQYGLNGQNQTEFVSQQADLSSKISELIEQNKISDKEISEKLQLAELEKQRVAEQYEARLRELEEMMKKREEEIKQEAYIEKLRNDIKFKKSESRYKQREEKIRESEKLISEKQLASEKLKAELKNCLNISNLEMDKKLLETANNIAKEKEKENDEFRAKVELEKEKEEQEEIEKPARTRTRTTRSTTRRRTSTVKSRMRTRAPRRKIDSDIIGGINFD